MTNNLTSFYASWAIICGLLAYWIVSQIALFCIQRSYQKSESLIHLKLKPCSHLELQCIPIVRKKIKLYTTTSVWARGTRHVRSGISLQQPCSQAQWWTSPGKHKGAGVLGEVAEREESSRHQLLVPQTLLEPLSAQCFPRKVHPRAWEWERVCSKFG